MLKEINGLLGFLLMVEKNI